MPRVTVAIRSFRGAERLPGTLASLVGTDVPGGFEVLVVDDGSDDGTADVARSFSASLPVRVVSHALNRGRAAAANTAFEKAMGEIVLVLDDDMRAEPGLVAKHAAAHATRGRIAAIGRIVAEGLDDGNPFHAFLLREDEWRRRTLLGAGEIGFGQVWTGQLSVARDEALAAGLFDETMRGYGLEDIEFAYRLAARGVGFVYLDESVSRHTGFMDDLDRYCSRHASVGANAAHLLRRHNTLEMRRYLRLDPNPSGEPSSMFLWLMHLSAAVLRRPRYAAFLAGPFANPILRRWVWALEAVRLTRPLGFAYCFLRDVRYFDALGRGLEREHGGTSSGSAPTSASETGAAAPAAIASEDSRSPRNGSSGASS